MQLFADKGEGGSLSQGHGHLRWLSHCRRDNRTCKRGEQRWRQLTSTNIPRRRTQKSQRAQERSFLINHEGNAHENHKHISLRTYQIGCNKISDKPNCWRGCGDTVSLMSHEGNVKCCSNPGKGYERFFKKVNLWLPWNPANDSWAFISKWKYVHRETMHKCSYTLMYTTSR